MSKRALLNISSPHSIAAALEARPEDCRSVRVPKQMSEEWRNIERLARRVGVRFEVGDRRSGNRQALGGAEVYERRPGEDWSSDSEKGLWLALDQVQDPQNLGAIFRTAAFFGVKGIFLTDRHSAGLSKTVYDVSAGGVERVPFYQVGNLAQLLDQLKENGFWILGSSEHADVAFSALKCDRKWVLVVGNEQSGLRTGTLKKCDEVVTIPRLGEVTSLNVSVATGLLVNQLTSE